jgi:hypothetical protein
MLRQVKRQLDGYDVQTETAHSLTRLRNQRRKEEEKRVINTNRGINKNDEDDLVLFWIL